MNPQPDDAMFEVLLAEAVGGPRPPDLTKSIVEALRTQSPQKVDSQADPRTRIADATLAEADSHATAPAIVTPPTAPRSNRRRTALVCCTWLASLAASVVLAGIFFNRSTEPLTSTLTPGTLTPGTGEPNTANRITGEPRAPQPLTPQIGADGTRSLAEPNRRTPIPRAETRDAAPGDLGPGDLGPVDAAPVDLGPVDAAPGAGNSPLGPPAALADARGLGSTDLQGTNQPIPFPTDPPNVQTDLPRPPAFDASVAYPAPPKPLADEAIVARIDTLLHAAWESAGIKPAAEVDAVTWSGRLSQVLGSPVAVPPSDTGRSDKAAGTSETIRRGLADPRARQTLSRKFAHTLLGEVGSERLSEVQREAFARWLSPAVGGEVRFDLVAAELLTARGSSAPDAEDFNPASLWLSALAGPRSVPLVDQFGHAILDLDLRCGRCHDHPLDGRVWQNQYWELNAVFQTSLRWSTDPGRELRVETVPPSARGADDVVFFELPDGRQRAVPPRTAWQWIAASAESRDAEQIARQAGDLEGLAAALENNPQLARAAVNRLWETVYGGPLIGSAADPSAPPESEALLQLQGELAEQLRAHDFDLSRAFSWIAAAAPMRLQTPSSLTVERFELATDAELRAAGEQLRHYAGYPPQLPSKDFSGLLAMVQQWDGDPSALGPRSDVALGQLGDPGNPSNPQNSAGKTPAKPGVRPAMGPGTPGAGRAEELILRAIYDSTATALRVNWLDRVGSGDAYDERALHLFYLAGYWNPSARQRAAAETLRIGVDDDDAVALDRLWWILSKEND